MSHRSGNWGEYVYQSDLDVNLYEVTIIAYELVDFLIENPHIKIPVKLRPFIDDIKKIIEPDILSFIEDTKDMN